ncbi:MAG TPA: hypothetical protein VJ754_06810 [Anaerolineae bacterium]|nr:hypothetical protein [Anaerolineae bacterium]
MPKQPDEIDRFMRIRDRQLNARDPLAKEKQFHGRISARAKNRKYTLKDALKDMQSKWVWMFVGGLIGLLLGLGFSYALPGEWADYAGIFMIFVGMALGRLVGAAVDWRSDDWSRRR